jgi:hypothetical protein
MCSYVSVCLQVCDWCDRSAVFAMCKQIVRSQIASGAVPSVQPHHALVYPIGVAEQHTIAKRYAAAALKNVSVQGLSPWAYSAGDLGARVHEYDWIDAADSAGGAGVEVGTRAGAGAGAGTGSSGVAGDVSGKLLTTKLGAVGAEADTGTGTGARAEVEIGADVGEASRPWRRRMRVGYVSSDIGNHPLSHLMMPVFLWHDKRRFEVSQKVLVCDGCIGWRWLHGCTKEWSHYHPYHWLLPFLPCSTSCVSVSLSCMCTSTSHTPSLQVFLYASSRDDGSKWRQQISTGVEHFVEVSVPTVLHPSCLPLLMLHLLLLDLLSVAGGVTESHPIGCSHPRRQH